MINKEDLKQLMMSGKVLIKNNKILYIVEVPEKENNIEHIIDEVLHINKQGFEVVEIKTNITACNFINDSVTIIFTIKKIT